MADEADDVDGAALAAAPDRPRPSRTKLALVTVPIVGLIVASNIGDSLTTTWAEDHPLALIALNGRNRILILTTNQLDPLSYYVVGTLRNLAADPLFFLLGVWYGDAAIVWIEKRSPTFGELVRKIEQGFGTAAYPLVVLAPNQWICLLAGAAGMRVSVFFALNILGMLGRLYLIRRLGERFETYIDDVLGFFRDYRLELFLLSVALVAVFMFLEWKRGKGDIGALRDLDRELELAEEGEGDDD